MKLSEEFIEKFCSEWVAKDIPIEFCCDGMGIHYTSYYGWMSKGEQDQLDNTNSLERKFYEKVKETYANVVKESIFRIKAGRLGWTGEAWMRERRDRQFVKESETSISNENITIITGMKKNANNKRG